MKKNSIKLLILMMPSLMSGCPFRKESSNRAFPPTEWSQAQVDEITSYARKNLLPQARLSNGKAVGPESQTEQKEGLLPPLVAKKVVDHSVLLNTILWCELKIKDAQAGFLVDKKLWSEKQLAFISVLHGASTSFVQEQLRALKSCTVEFRNHLIKNYPSYIVDDRPQWLFHACRNGDFNVARMLLEDGVSLDYLGPGNDSIAHAAVLGGNLEILKLVLQKGADTEKETTIGETPIWSAVWIENHEMFLTLLNSGANLKHRNSSGDSLIYYAANIGNLPAVKILLEKGFSIEEKAQNKIWTGQTLLMTALQNDRRDLVDFLLQKGADVNARNSTGQTPLFRAFRLEHNDYIKPLVAKGANINAQDNFGRTPLMFAAMADNLDAARILLSLGADKKLKSKSGETARSLARNPLLKNLLR